MPSDPNPPINPNPNDPSPLPPRNPPPQPCAEAPMTETEAVRENAILRKDVKRMEHVIETLKARIVELAGRE